MKIEYRPYCFKGMFGLFSGWAVSDSKTYLFMSQYFVNLYLLHQEIYYKVKNFIIKRINQIDKKYTYKTKSQSYLSIYTFITPIIYFQL